MTRYIAKTFAIAALLSSGAAYAGTPGWQVSETSGSVSIARNGIVKVAKRQTKLIAGDVIKTGPKGRAVLLRGGEYLVVSPASHIEIAEPKKSGAVTQIIEYFGNVLFRIDKKANPHFGVKTPYMAAVVKGTTFSVSVSPEGTAVQVTEGAVQVATLDDGASQLVTPGVIGMINANDPFSLVIIDGERRVIESPNKPQSGPESKSANISVKAPPVKASSRLSGTISVPIVEEGVELAALTNDLIRGDVGYGAFIALENAQGAPGTAENSTSGINSGDNGGDTSVSEELVAGDETTDDGSGGEQDNGNIDENAAEDDDGNNGHGNDDDGVDDSNPGNGGGKDKGDDDDDIANDNDGDGGGKGKDKDDEDDDGNNGHGNDDDGVDDSNPGNGGGKDKGDDDDDDANDDDGDDGGKGKDKDDDDDDDGNNGHGNDDDGEDDGNPGKGGGKGKNPKK